MAKHTEHGLVVSLRKRGMSYSQIKAKVQVSKSTLSRWLQDMPLSEKRLRELRDFSAQRIEKTRETKRKKKIARIQGVYDSIVREFGTITKRELYIGGFFLYWGEGLKANAYTIMFTNTDPGMVRCFMEWMHLFGVQRKQFKVYLHVYRDMDIGSVISFWSKELGIAKTSFRRPYVKATDTKKRRNYKGRFGYGTCNVYITNRDIREKIAAGIARIKELYGGVRFDPAKAL